MRARCASFSATVFPVSSRYNSTPAGIITNVTISDSQIKRELVRLPDEDRTEGDDLRVDVEASPDEGDLEHHVDDESDRQDDAAQG